MEYKIDDQQLNAAVFIRFANKVWPGKYDEEKTAIALSKTLNITAYDGDTLVDATAYPDMAELLCAANLLITDYSSSMFDYALTGKPIIQFATDIAAYQKDRDFYFPLDALPFPLAKSNEELEAVLTDLQPLWTSSAWAEFARENDFCEDGEAAVRCAALILQQMQKQ